MSMTPGQKLAQIAREQKENTGKFLEGLKKENDPTADEMIKIKNAWDAAKKSRRITLWQFALDYDKK